MLVLYTSPGCASCRKAKQWLKENEIEYIEKNIFSSVLNENELKYILSRSENGIDDIVSKRSKVIREGNLDIDEMSVSEVIDLVKKNPSTLKRPIMINEKNLMVGYDDEEIEVFAMNKIKNEMVRSCSCDCPQYEQCEENVG